MLNNYQLKVLKILQFFLENDLVKQTVTLSYNENLNCNNFLQATNLTGLVVNHNPHYVLSRYYKRILLVINKMPESSLYRKHVERIVKERSKIVETVGFKLY